MNSRLPKLWMLNALMHWVLLTIPCGLLGQSAVDLPFESGSTGADGPLNIPNPGPSLSWHAMAYDSGRAEIIALTSDSQTWKWDATNWQQVLTATNPSARSYSAMVYDEARQNVVLFGGTAGQRETWTWNGSNWANRTEAVLTTSNAPPGTYGHAMVYDPTRQEVICIGGASGSNETWIWNGNSWRLAGLLGVQPGNYIGLSFDRARQRAVLFGGDSNRRETWEWDGSSWINRTGAFVTDANTPPARNSHAMTYDHARQRTVLFGGSSGLADTWEWDGANWVNRTPTAVTPFNSPSARFGGSMSYDTARQQAVLVGGHTGPQETWFWDGSNWRIWGGPTYYFDMTGRGNGIWNFATIKIATNVTVKFNHNANNTPVRWLASGNVQIDGIIEVSGQTAQQTTVSSEIALGGPGGFAGGRGAIATNQSGSATGSPGDGPGGGDPGTAASPTGQDGRYAGVYGNPYLQPLIGGSGGGGGGSTATSHGGSGAGGGGAILISSSRDITVAGQILANGGSYSYSASAGGYGSGGAVFLKADRISGSGSLRAEGSRGPGTDGRIRLEAYYRQLAGTTTPASVNSLPVVDQASTNNASLRITSVDGVPVPPSPGGSALVPDVVFTNLNPVSILVTANSIPLSTPVRLRVTSGSGVILATNILSGPTTTFSVPVPPGVGTVQAFAEFPIGN